MTVSDVATKFNVHKNLAYAFLKFMELRGLVTATTKHTPGVRGKGQKEYVFTDTASQDFNSLIKTFQNT
jgi:predicted ArsR family transcriptional regulator